MVLLTESTRVKTAMKSHDTSKSQLCNLTQNQNCYAKFFSINPEYNEDNGIVIKAFHAITLNSSEETIVQINYNKPKKNWPTK